MVDRSQIQEGMVVKSLDGEKLGKVTATHADTFYVEKGFFFPKEYVASYQEISTVRDGDIILGSSSTQLRGAWRADTDETEERQTDRYREQRRGERPYGEARSAARTEGEELRVPVAEEELDVVKRQRDAGDVRVTKEVITEEKTMRVPVTREEIHVERVPRTDQTLREGEHAFEEGEIRVPLHEEEVEVTKRPVVREEVRISKELHGEEEEITEDLRRERVKVDDSTGDEPRTY